MNKMAGDAQTRKKLRTNERQTKVAELYLRQKSQQDIASILGISQATVSRDLQAVQKSWREASLMNLNEAKQRELERIDVLEREYWAAWEESKKPKERTKSEREDGDATKVKAEMQRDTQTGNPSYLEGVRWCINKRCEILGLDAPRKLSSTTPDGAEHKPFSVVEIVKSYAE
jgi:predicted transcriptional regulator